ncbi:COP9 signalosome complex subunit 3 [Apophysomyces sp. BC1021]|nr:COP9 signalosome complex subunit 3 [Apophysomyces sp. BC1021]
MQTGDVDRQSQAIDEVVALIVSAESNIQRLERLLFRLNAFSDAKLQSYTSEQLDPLTIFDPAAHSLGYLYFITARCIAADAQTSQQLLDLLSHFIHVFDQAQVRLAPARFTYIAKALEVLAQHLKNASSVPMIPIRPLTEAIHRYSPQPNVLTSLHAPLAKACLLAKMYKNPLPLLKYDIERVEPTKYDITIESFLEYHYYGAMIYIGNKDFERAIHFLTLIRALPKYTATAVDKVFKQRFGRYQEIIKAFDKSDIVLLEKVFNKYRDTWEADSHIGLVKQCVEALRRKKIREFTDIYITVSLRDLTAKLGYPGTTTERKVEAILVDMIAQSQISASISYVLAENQRIKMVNFHDSDETDSPNALNNLEARIFRAANINKKVADMDKSEGLNKEFQAKYMTHTSNGGQLSSMPYDEDIDLPLDEDAKMFA